MIAAEAPNDLGLEFERAERFSDHARFGQSTT
jgi:hypothetical protein